MFSFRSNAAAVLAFLLVMNLAIAGCGKKQESPAAAQTPKAEVTAQQAAKGAVSDEAASGAAAVVTGVAAVIPVPSTAPITEERTFYDFEGDLAGWEVPAWALGKTDHVAKEVVLSQDFASKGKTSMKVTADFYGGAWTAALIEIQQYLDISGYRAIRADIYLPADAPIGLKAKLILTVGDNWKFVEMNGAVPLMPGEWATITASIEPGSYDWKRVVPDENFAKDVRKIAVRIESNNKPKYAGVLYIDNVRVGK